MLYDDAATKMNFYAIRGTFNSAYLSIFDVEVVAVKRRNIFSFTELLCLNYSRFYSTM